MATATPPHHRPWRVAITTGEVDSTASLRVDPGAGLTLVPCPILDEAPPDDVPALIAAAAHLARYDWVLCASARAVAALRRHHPRQWPAGVRSAAVGSATAAALLDFGAAPAPVTAPTAGAEALWAMLEPLDDWVTRAVLVLSTPGGRTTLADQLRSAGATTDLVYAYRMVPRPLDAIQRDWHAAAPDAVVIGSPRTARTLAEAVGEAALSRLEAVVAIGDTTRDALTALGVACVVSPAATYAAALETAARLQAQGAPA